MFFGLKVLSCHYSAMDLIQLLVLMTCAATTATADTNPRGYPVQIPPSCGISFTAYPTASTSGSVTCASTVPTPSSNARLRIEGSDGTIFEDCIAAGPREITTPSSGGAHICDGTNNGANSNPGTVPTAQLDAAAALTGFDYDGDWYPDFEDFLITRIGSSAQTDTQFWGILVNGQYTPTGGCQFEVGTGDETLFAFDAFNKDVFLNVEPEYAVAEVGRGVVNVTVTDAMTGEPQAGVAFGGLVTDADGSVNLPVPNTPGCYRFKATRDGALRSNTFYLTVVSIFGDSLSP
ncbi:hypothetical protein F4860DRAFT_463888 [Xylaria cubensis]|nr:hypothetical protein F4860DRAFT_463888 [Xylaria cubensis]